MFSADRFDRICQRLAFSFTKRMLVLELLSATLFVNSYHMKSVGLMRKLYGWEVRQSFWWGLPNVYVVAGIEINLILSR